MSIATRTAAACSRYLPLNFTTRPETYKAFAFTRWTVTQTLALFNLCLSVSNVTVEHDGRRERDKFTVASLATLNNKHPFLVKMSKVVYGN